MKTKKVNKGGSRQGKHKPENVLLGAMVSPRKKAIAMITAGVAAADGSMTLTDLIWNGVENIAKAFGVIDENGEVTSKYADAVLLAEFQVAETKKERQSRI